MIALLAVAMGLRNGTVRKLGVPDLTTTVLTLTLTGIAADSSLAGGANPRLGGRLYAVLAMLAGAAPGAALVIHGHLGWALPASTLLVAAIALDSARERGLAVLPYCPFIRGWLGKHPDYVDLVPQDQLNRFGL
ncbi:DUF1275 family protein [Kitasatospora sp. NPDC008050]|uniref:DUF1275 family protein n=1 Tax=Kitasatospora sp. NPDC008050 TaxID=3364021 RepID=UPI0036E3AF8D